MQKGTINVQSGNIFPIIKKFLYSDHEIFLRELVSNAVDATQKLKTLSSLGEVKGDLDDLEVEVLLDKDTKTLTVCDRGIGMTSQEVDKYINQVAFSGAEEFLKKYKGKTGVGNIIGHFGLGFYSSFMVAGKVEIDTKSYRKSAAVRWECDGSPNYTLDASGRKDRGTEVILHINEESAEFLEEERIRGILVKYCKFVPVPIRFLSGKDKKKRSKDDIINNPAPAWTKVPAKLQKDDYLNFYRELYPFTFEEPLFHIHLHVDYPFNLTGILYFPKLKDNLSIQKNKIQLYSNQVFVTDNVEGIVPDFLNLLHGVMDSPDIPLNVSRSYLQNDAAVRKISSHISKKVSDKLAELFNGDRKDFEKKWDDIRIFIEFGMIADEKFYERARKFALFKTTAGRHFTLDELTEKIKGAQTDKDGRLVCLYASDREGQHAYIRAAEDRGYEVVLLDSPLTGHFVGKLEQKTDKVSFARVDADTIDKLIKKGDNQPSKLTDDQQKQLKPVIEGIVPKEKFAVVFESLSEKDQPMTVTQPEFSRRMKDMSAVGGDFSGEFPGMYNLVVNVNHPLIGRILVEPDHGRQEAMARQAADLALLSQNMLRGQAMTDFIRRSVELIGK